MTERIIDEELRLIPYYRNDAASLPWYGGMGLCALGRPILDTAGAAMSISAADLRHGRKAVLAAFLSFLLSSVN